MTSGKKTRSHNEDQALAITAPTQEKVALEQKTETFQKEIDEELKINIVAKEELSKLIKITQMMNPKETSQEWILEWKQPPGMRVA